ncbi:hypothetical protein B0H17DRAFT_1104084 [Mycena rosella]|uniref:Myb-like domain-containing protein n=1 Tax=Mycena rosella TaxID=1033263 RepID=A0AAD7FVI3_MYCRO|nr:hypothetical protein B0H17DRAFT_1104084 [Mycena rosella]
MDNPQHYQPLSHALHPPNTSTTPKPGAAPSHQQEEQEEEEGDEENLVADHLNPNDHASSASASTPAGTGDGSAQEHQFLQEPDPGGKRRPGRPRGSKNRKIQSPPGPAPPKPDALSSHPTGTGSAPPQLPDVNSQNQQYYEFQWRVLNLCAEFYGAAEELVKGTPPLVVAQCYQMGPGSKVDPLIMLNEAKRICDTLLANPTQLISTPPPPLNPVVPTFYHPQPVAGTSAPPKASTSTAKPTPAPVPAPAPAPVAAPPSNVITNPGSFVVSLGTQPAYAYPSYAPSTVQYPGAYYAPYGYPAGAYYPAGQGQPQAQPQPAAQPAAKPHPPPPQASTSALKPPSASGNGGNQGPWSDDEVERLKKLAEDSKARSGTGETDWDWVVGEWGPGRTRHQILLKATGLGLKESKGRGNKRRRETDDPATPASPVPPPNPATVNSKIAMSASTSNTGSPAMSHATSTPIPSPSMSHLQRPTSAKGHAPQPIPAPASASTLPWPMPTVAAANVSPVLSPSVQGEQRTSYYRPRPPADASGTAARAPTHQFMYQNGPVQNSAS